MKSPPIALEEISVTVEGLEDVLGPFMLEWR